MTYSLCEWFMQTYGDWNYQNQPFVMPSETEMSNYVVADKEQEKKFEDELTKEAEKTALSAPKVSQEERRKQSALAAGKRQPSEAETRYLIDEQLRKVGWKADTEQLRYSKGTRPEKGRNMAIAEWPTDSQVGNRGYADYALFVGTELIATIEAKASHKDILKIFVKRTVSIRLALGVSIKFRLLLLRMANRIWNSIRQNQVFGSWIYVNPIMLREHCKAG